MNRTNDVDVDWRAGVRVFLKFGGFAVVAHLDAAGDHILDGVEIVEGG